jgi:signal transduction histidine kinase
VYVLLAKTLRSTTFTLALISIGVFGAIVISLLSYVYWSTASYMYSRSDRAIMAEYALLQGTYQRDGRDALIALISRSVSARHFEVSRYYLLANASLAPIAGNLQRWPSDLTGSEGWKSFTAQDRGPAAGERPLVRARFETLPDGSHLLVGIDISDLQNLADRIQIAFAWAIGLIFVLAGVASVSVTRRTVGRLETINAISREIMQTGLGKRVPLRGTRDEWDQVAKNLNLMLDRIEALMGEVKQVTDNVAHDLRTPLARMRGRLENAYNRQRANDEDQSLIGETIADLDSVLRVFSSLMRISQIEATDRKAAFRIVDLGEMAREVAELFDAAAEETGAHLTVVGGQQALIKGDRDLLFDAAANLVDNAIKHGQKASVVTIEAARRDQGVIFSVADDGPGIPPNEREHVLKRFYRLEQSRSSLGNGLGLSLVAAVARLHGARIEMLDNAPGLKFRLWFPEPATAPGEAKREPRSAAEG